MAPPWRGVALILSLILPALVTGVQFLNSDYSGVTAGEDFTLTWNGDGTVSISPFLFPS